MRRTSRAQIGLVGLPLALAAASFAVGASGFLATFDEPAYSRPLLPLADLEWPSTFPAAVSAIGVPGTTAIDLTPVALATESSPVLAAALVHEAPVPFRPAPVAAVPKATTEPAPAWTDNVPRRVPPVTPASPRDGTAAAAGDTTSWTGMENEPSPGIVVNSGSGRSQVQLQQPAGDPKPTTTPPPPDPTSTPPPSPAPTPPPDGGNAGKHGNGLAKGKDDSKHAD